MSRFPKVWGDGNSQDGEKLLAPLAAATPAFGKNQTGTTRVERQGAFSAIILEPEAATRPLYEFFTSDHVDPTTLSTPGAPTVTNEFGITYQPVLGSGVSYSGGAGKAIFSSELEPVDGGPKFAIIPAGSEAYFDSSSDYYLPFNRRYFATWASWQNQKFFEHVWWPGNGKKELVTSTQGIGSGTANMAGWYGPCVWQQSSRARMHDVGRDVIPALYTPDNIYAGAPYLPTHKWWRHAAVQTVRDATWGTRRFFVLTDSHGNFYVYPVRRYDRIYTGGDGDHYTSLPEAAFTVATPPYPDWVTQPDQDTANEYGQWFWSFNKDATKAVTIAFNRREPVGIWRVGYADGSLNPATYTQETAWVSKTKLEYQYDSSTFDHSLYDELKEDAPGLVEVNIGITLTGPDPMDFSVDLTLGRTDYWHDSHRYYVSAGYALESSGQTEDALLTAEVEVFWQAGSSEITVDTGGGGTAAYTIAPRIARYGEEIDYANEAAGGGSPPSTGHAYEDGWDDMESGRYGLGFDNILYGTGTEFDAFFTVRDWSADTIAKRVALRRNFYHSPPFRHLRFTGWSTQGLGQVAEDHVATSFLHVDLRSMSFLQRETTAHAAGLGFDAYSFITRLIAHNAERATSTFSVDAGTGLYADGAGALAVPMTPMTEPRDGFTNFVDTGDSRDFDYLLMVMQALALNAMALQMNQGIAVHPNGSYSCGSLEFGDLQGTLDVVQAAGKTPTTHRALFNQAFAQARDTLYYGDVTEGDGDSGSFCTAGIWLPPST